MRPRVPFKNLMGAVPPFPLAEGGVALLVLDVHRFTVDRGVGYARLAQERGIQRELAEYYEQAEIVLENLERLLHGCRRRAVPVIFTRLAVGDERDVSPQARVTGFWTSRAHPEADFLPTLSPRAGERVIDRTTVSPFRAPGLEEDLAAAGSRYVLLAGIAANGTVEQTARDAADLGYGVVVVSDACAADTWALHTHMMTTLVGGLIRVRSVDHVIEMLDRSRT